MVSELVGTLGLASESDRRAVFLCPKRFREVDNMRCFLVQIHRPDPEFRKWAVIEIRRDLRERSEGDHTQAAK
jgi:hypothetical protein